jgi:outer membrane lipoprotein-sorting protein
MALAVSTASLCSQAQSAGARNANAGSADSGELPKVIAQLDAAAARFKSAQADFSWDQYQAIVQDHEIQSGVIYFERRNSTTTRMAAYFKPAAGQEPNKIVVYDGSQLQYYQPTIKQMSVYRAGSNSGQFESFLTLGFGGSGTDLQKNWDVTLLGKETINNIEVIKLDLKPKAQNVQNMFTHVTIWVDPTRAVSLKQIFYAPSGDQQTDTFTNIKYNQSIPESVFQIKPPPDVQIQKK